MTIKYFPRGTHFNGPIKLGAPSMLLSTDQVGGFTAAKTLSVAESNGQHYILDHSAGFTITLPPPTQGWTCKFTVGTAFATTNYIFTAGTADTFEGSLMVAGAVVDIDASDIITLPADKENVGDYIEFWSDGTSTFTYGNFLTAAAAAGTG